MQCKETTMNYPENRFLFTVKDITNSCGISRATLIRMEQSGFLTPYKIDENTGYRYYDTNNIAQIGQYQLLQDLGLSRKEITDLYLRRIDIEPFIEEQRLKINRLQRALNELELRYTKKKDYNFSFTEIPKISCICKTVTFSSMENMETFAYDMYQHVFQEGFHVDGKEPLFAYAPNNMLDFSSFPNPQTDITLCIPVIDDKTNNPRITSFPACYACSLIGYGNYSVITDMAQQLLKEVSQRKLKPIGPLRVNLLVAPYAGMHISEKDYCSELILPIERDS